MPDCATTEVAAEVAGVGTSSAANMAADAARALNSTWACGVCEGVNVFVKKNYIDDYVMILIILMWLFWNLRWAHSALLCRV